MNQLIFRLQLLLELYIHVCIRVYIIELMSQDVRFVLVRMLGEFIVGVSQNAVAAFP